MSDETDDRTVTQRTRTGYTPLLALPWWDTIGPFLTPLVEEAAAVLEIPAGRLYPVVTPYILWWWQHKGLELDAHRMFQRQRIEHFIAVGAPTLSRGSRNTFRGRLLRMAEVVAPQEGESLQRIGRSAPTPPYSSAQLAALYSWSRSLGTKSRRRDSAVLLALGLGAGLATRELLSVRLRDVGVDAASVSVSSSRVRTVTIEEAWRGVLVREFADMPSASWAFRPGRQGAVSSQVTDFVRKTGTDLDIRPARMRATWLVARLSRNDPADTLLAESGLSTFAALDKYKNMTV